jgi:hypothetical protein
MAFAGLLDAVQPTPTPTPVPRQSELPNIKTLHKILDHAKYKRATELKKELLNYTPEVQKIIIEARLGSRYTVIKQANYLRDIGYTSVYDVLVELNLV